MIRMSQKKLTVLKIRLAEDIMQRCVALDVL